MSALKPDSPSNCWFCDFHNTSNSLNCLACTAVTVPSGASQDSFDPYASILYPGPAVLNPAIFLAWMEALSLQERGVVKIGTGIRQVRLHLQAAETRLQRNQHLGQSSPVETRYHGVLLVQCPDGLILYSVYGQMIDRTTQFDRIQAISGRWTSGAEMDNHQPLWDALNHVLNLDKHLPGWQQHVQRGFCAGTLLRSDLAPVVSHRICNKTVPSSITRATKYSGDTRGSKHRKLTPTQHVEMDVDIKATEDIPGIRDF